MLCIVQFALGAAGACLERVKEILEYRIRRRRRVVWYEVESWIWMRCPNLPSRGIKLCVSSPIVLKIISSKYQKKKKKKKTNTYLYLWIPTPLLVAAVTDAVKSGELESTTTILPPNVSNKTCFLSFVSAVATTLAPIVWQTWRRTISYKKRREMHEQTDKAARPVASREWISTVWYLLMFARSTKPNKACVNTRGTPAASSKERWGTFLNTPLSSTITPQYESKKTNIKT